jgi:uncharacterized protein YegP (UPF0339 family)
MNNPKFEIFKSSADSKFYFRLRSANNEIILASQGYGSKQSCETGIASVKMNALHDVRYIRNQNGSSYTFNLTAANGEIIGRSESYTTAQSRENGIAAVKRDAPVAGVEDLG